MNSQKDFKYDILYKQIKSLLEGEQNEVGSLANVASVLHHEMNFWWTGFYLVCGDELWLGPFQGPVACMRIKYGKGVCGTAWKERKSQVVCDVEQFPGHIACSSLSRSEIVVPIFNADNEVVGVLDIDSKQLGTFDEADRHWLEKIVALLSDNFYKKQQK